MIARATPLLVLALALACSGRRHPVGAGEPDAAPTGMGGALPPPISMPDTLPTDITAAPPLEAGTTGERLLRRLTVFELTNTVRDLLGQTLPPGLIDAVGHDQVTSGTPFVRGAPIQQGNVVMQLLTIAERLARTAVDPSRIGMLVPSGCALPTPDEEDPCVLRLIRDFGTRAFRRPVPSEESARLFTVYKSQRLPPANASYPDAIRVLVTAMLSSHAFLYRWDLGLPPQTDPVMGRPTNLVPFDGYEIASRLSYLIWASLPDQALLDAAAVDLTSPARIDQHVRRMLLDPRAKDGMAELHRQWLELGDLPILPKDPAFPEYTPEIGPLLARETDDVVGQALVGEKAPGTLESLLTRSGTVIDPRLGWIYGITVAGTGPTEVALDPSQRAGILTLGGFLATHANSDQTNPVKRGHVILHALLCAGLEPPPDVNIPSIPEPTPGATFRERLAHTTSEPTCATCHSLINPIGLAFESYDAVGRYRTTEEGKPIITKGSIKLPSGETITFDDAPHLVRLLARSRDVHACVTQQWARWLLRRRETEGEAREIGEIAARFFDQRGDFRHLLHLLTQSRLFTHRARTLGDGSFR